MRYFSCSKVFFSLLAMLILSVPVAAQSEPPKKKPSDNPFFRTAIPKNVPSAFVCHQGGVEIIKLDGITSFLPSKVSGIFTYSLITKDGQNHLLYLGAQTTCRLSVTPPAK